MKVQGTVEGQGAPFADAASGLTLALKELRNGKPGALDRVVPLLYDDLRRLARQRLRSEAPQHTLGTTGVVHEAYMRLLKTRRLTARDRGEFLAAASNTMRRLLVDYARAKKRLKRGGGLAPLPLEEAEPFLSDEASSEMLDLDRALGALAAAMPRAARTFELHTFGGLELKEIAEIYSVSMKTAHRDLTAARAWLRKEVRARPQVDEEPAS